MFEIGKVLGALSEPLSLVLLMLAAGLVLSGRPGRATAGRRLIALALALVVIPAIVPLGAMAGAALENRFPRPAPPARVDGIVVLGGMIDARVSAARGEASPGAAIGRLVALRDLMARYPEARVIFTGGSGSVLHPEAREAPYARAFLASIGVETGRVVFEEAARSTHENALFAAEIARPQPEETWLLVTSAFHMPRSVGAFRAVGWQVVPWPVAYHTTGAEATAWADLRFAPTEGLAELAQALHEGVGLAAYRLMGWSDALVPGP